MKKGVGAKIEYELYVDCEGTVSRTSHMELNGMGTGTNNFNWLCKQQFMQLFNS